MFSVSVGLPPNLPFEEYGRLARVVEEFPFEAIFVDDIPHFKSCWAILQTLARNTSRVKLGTSVTHPFFRHPLVTASEVAALDEVSGGRAILGIGRGDREYYEYAGIQVDRPIAAVKEAVILIRRFLGGDNGGYRGKVFYAKGGLGLGFSPLRSGVPIYIGTTGPTMFQLAGEIADGVQSAGLCSPAYVKVAKENVELGARRAGRDPRQVRVGADIWTCLSDDREEAASLLSTILAQRIPKLTSMAEALGIPKQEAQAIEQAAARGDLEAAARAVSWTSINALTICGTPDDAVQRIERLKAAGLEHVTLKKPLGPDVEKAIRLIGEKVVPRVASR